ncbi:MAG TPA: hypothetical protein ENG87_05350, partial [Candidatus Pacearchaeota archaeon]|nr:hypothetical protein [Candidatus Pacearchaeota archaeon]
MVYKRYIKRKVNGKIKTFGPYYYESHKDKDGNVVSKYISGPKRSKRIRSVTVKKQPRKFSKKYLFLSLVIGIVILLSAGLFVLNQKTSLTSKSLVPNISSGEAGFSRKIEQSKENFVVSSARKVYSFLTGFVTEEAAPEAP